MEVPMTKFSSLVSSAALAVALAAPAAVASAETLRLVTNWSTSSYSVERTLQCREEFNASEAAQAADLQIIYMGGQR
jgi:hypothetical protein